MNCGKSLGCRMRVIAPMGFLVHDIEEHCNVKRLLAFCFGITGVVDDLLRFLRLLMIQLLSSQSQVYYVYADDGPMSVPCTRLADVGAELFVLRCYLGLCN